MLNNEKEKTRKHSKKEAKLLSGTHKNYKIDGYLFKDMVRCGAEELRRKRQEINQLNVFPVPDGDTGDNMSMTMDSGIRAIEDLDTNDLSKVIEAFSHGTLLGARGNSGVILSQFFKLECLKTIRENQTHEKIKQNKVKTSTNNRKWKHTTEILDIRIIKNKV